MAARVNLSPKKNLGRSMKDRQRGGAGGARPSVLQQRSAGGTSNAARGTLLGSLGKDSELSSNRFMHSSDHTDSRDDVSSTPSLLSSLLDDDRTPKSKAKHSKIAPVPGITIPPFTHLDNYVQFERNLRNPPSKHST